MSKIAIKAENLGKAYQLGEFSTGTISRDIERWWAKMQGKEDPFLKIGETNDRTSKGSSDIVWSLKDIDFEINQGDAVGIIGRNGAGKSTLLKVLSRVTTPTTGFVKVKGRIASLLEVGTGFHPELTGRENIFLNGAILGMRKHEIKRHFDAIVDFAGVERYIDTPVKRYSSGMYVRLAFAVAAHLDSEILIVDEVLAVGDAEFQKKCLGKMGEVSQGQGRTVLFVSHNMGSIQALCNRSILMQNGRLDSFGETMQIINKYMASNSDSTKKPLKERTDRHGSGELRFNSIQLFDKSKKPVDIIGFGEDLNLVLSYNINSNGFKFENFHFSINVFNSNGVHIIQQTSKQTLLSKTDLTGNVDIKLSDINLAPGNYYVSIDCVQDEKFLDYIDNAFSFIIETSHQINNRVFHTEGIVIPKTQWSCLQ